MLCYLQVADLEPGDGVLVLCTSRQPQASLGPSQLMFLIDAGCPNCATTSSAAWEGFLQQNRLSWHALPPVPAVLAGVCEA